MNLITGVIKPNFGNIIINGEDITQFPIYTRTKTKEEIISKFAQSKGDTGSPEVQIALLTANIER